MYVSVGYVARRLQSLSTNLELQQSIKQTSKVSARHQGLRRRADGICDNDLMIGVLEQSVRQLQILGIKVQNMAYMQILIPPRDGTTNINTPPDLPGAEMS